MQIVFQDHRASIAEQRRLFNLPLEPFPLAVPAAREGCGSGGSCCTHPAAGALQLCRGSFVPALPWAPANPHPGELKALLSPARLPSALSLPRSAAGLRGGPISWQGVLWVPLSGSWLLEMHKAVALNPTPAEWKSTCGSLLRRA